MGDRKEGPGGGSSPHNAHKWRAGPPLLCLGRKGRDPRRGPLNGSIVSDPPVPLGVLLVSPRLHFQLRVWGSADSAPPCLWWFWGPHFPLHTRAVEFLGCGTAEWDVG